VAEWTTSPYQAYKGGTGNYPKGQVVIRGGDFATDREFARGSARRGALPAEGKPTVGFRCVRVFGFKSLKEHK
jgi:formylglycine-generating enzyme required for sulfatase activity